MELLLHFHGRHSNSWHTDTRFGGVKKFKIVLHPQNRLIFPPQTFCTIRYTFSIHCTRMALQDTSVLSAMLAMTCVGHATRMRGGEGSTRGNVATSTASQRRGGQTQPQPNWPREMAVWRTQSETGSCENSMYSMCTLISSHSIA